jgi:hypothetical protein
MFTGSVIRVGRHLVLYNVHIPFPVITRTAHTWNICSSFISLLADKKKTDGLFREAAE